MVLSFIVCSNRNRSALACDFLSNNSLFVGQLYKDKSLALRTRDLFFFTNDLQTVITPTITARADPFLKRGFLTDSLELDIPM